MDSRCVFASDPDLSSARIGKFDDSVASEDHQEWESHDEENAVDVGHLTSLDLENKI